MVATVNPRLGGIPQTWQILAQSGVAVSGAADTAENILASITVPAGAMGPNGSLRISASWTYTSSGNNKTPRIRFGGIGGWVFLGPTLTTTTLFQHITTISNRNAPNSQVGSWAASANPTSIAAVTGSIATGAADTTAATTILLTGEKALGSETLTLERYLVELAYGA